MAFLESDFDALFRAEGAATIDAFDLSAGDAALVLLCSRGSAVRAFTAAGSVGEGARAGKGSGGGVAGEYG